MGSIDDQGTSDPPSIKGPPTVDRFGRSLDHLQNPSDFDDFRSGIRKSPIIDMSRTNPIDLEAFGMERQSWGTNFAAFRRMGPFLRAYLEYFEPIYSNISISSIEPNRIGSFWSGTEKLGDQFRRMGPFLRDYLTFEKGWGTNLRGKTRKYPAKKGFLGVGFLGG